MKQQGRFRQFGAKRRRQNSTQTVAQINCSKESPGKKTHLKICLGSLTRGYIILRVAAYEITKRTLLYGTTMVKKSYFLAEKSNNIT